MTTTTVRVFLNRQEDESGRLAIFARFGDDAGYQAGDEMEHVLTYEAETDSEGRFLERVFSDLNRGSGTFLGDVVYQQRSLCVGDVVEAAGTYFAVANTGFRMLDDDEAATVEQVTV